MVRFTTHIVYEASAYFVGDQQLGQLSDGNFTSVIVHSTATHTRIYTASTMLHWPIWWAWLCIQLCYLFVCLGYPAVVLFMACFHCKIIIVLRSPSSIHMPAQNVDDNWAESVEGTVPQVNASICLSLNHRNWQSDSNRPLFPRLLTTNTNNTTTSTCKSIIFIHLATVRSVHLEIPQNNEIFKASIFHAVMSLFRPTDINQHSAMCA